MEGRLRLIQAKDGYRFSVDALLLSQFVTARPGDVVIDLGTGCGIIPLILLLTRPVKHAFGLEIQAELADQAARNAQLNGFTGRMDVILGDIRCPPLGSGCADLVTCNPPYRQVRSGRINPDLRRAIARHEILASIDDILSAASRLLGKKGRLGLIYPAVRLVDLMVRMRRFQLEPKKVQINYPSPGSSAKLALVEAWLGARPGVEICPPLVGQGNSENGHNGLSKGR
jgi:tRNA1Val (adenine37-N6)-methyltransferase